MNSAIEREEEVFLRFNVCAGEKILWIPKKDWEEKWEEKVENADDQYDLTNLVYEMEHKYLRSEDHLEFELHEVSSA